MIRFWAGAIIAVCVFVLPATACAASLTIMAEDASEPFSRADGTGYANDIVRAAFEAAHIDVKLDVVPYARCKKSLEDGTIAACFAMSWAPDSAKTIVFSDQPLYEVYADVFRNRKSPEHPVRAQDIRKGALVGIVNAYEYPQTIYRLADQGIVLERGINEWSNLQMLARGRLDAAVVMTSDFLGAHQRLSAAGVADSVGYAFRSGTLKSYIGFSTINRDGERARKAFNEGYRIIVQNHTRDKIREKWMQSAQP
jgi:polar amino acid transport system substrate-binding protein